MADEERLVIALEARIRDFERNMNKAKRSAVTEFDAMEARAKLSGDRLESTMAKAAGRMGAVMKGMGGAIIGGIAAGGIAGIVGQIGQIAKGIASVGDQAKRAGVSNRVFQEWAIVAEQARIPVDALTDGLKELQLRGDEFAVTGKGAAAEAFSRLGYGAAELKRKLEDPSALLLEIIDRLGKFDKAAQIRISDELFGGSAGERFVELLDQGAAGIRATIDEAHRLGNVLSDDVITRAAEIDRQFQIVSRTVGTALKGAIVNAAGALQSFIDSFRDFENQQTKSLGTQLATIGKRRLDLENHILKLQGEQRDAIVGNPFGHDYDSDIADLKAEREALGETEAQILAVVEARRKAAEVPAPKSADNFVPAPYTPPVAATGGAKRDPAASAAERERKAVAALFKELERELQLIGATDLERKISNELRTAGAAATDDQKVSIVALITAIEAEEQAQQKSTDAKEEFASIANGMLTGFISDLRSSASAGEAFGNMINRLLDKLVDMTIQLLIIGPLMKAFGFSGGGYVSAIGTAPKKLAGGGHVTGPGTSTSDSIPALLSDGEFVVNAAATRKHRALLEAVNDNLLPGFANGGIAARKDGLPLLASNDNTPSIAINAPITVNGSAGTPQQNDDLARKMAKQLEATMRGTIAAEIQNAQRNGNPLNRRG